MTGCGRGIGRAIAVRLATEGAAVVGSQRNAEEGDALVESLAARGLELAFVAGDVRDEGHCERLVTATVERYGRVDVLCNNAGVGLLKSVVETEREEYDRVLDTNLWGLFACSRHAIPHMVAGGGGSVVNIGSVAASVGFATDAAYCASKGAVHALTRQMALDYARAPDPRQLRRARVHRDRAGARSISTATTTPRRPNGRRSPCTRWAAWADRRRSLRWSPSSPRTMPRS